MEYTTPTFDVNLDPEGLVIDLDSLYAALARLHDRRHARGVRYALVTILIYIVLAKLAGQDRLSGIAEWVRYRQEQLAEALHLSHPRSPCVNTYRTILGETIDVEEFEQVVREFFAAQPQAGHSRLIALDGKALRGTRSAGQTQARHLLAAYLPAEGWVLFQVEVASKENEITAAPRVLKSLDLRGKIVTGDAIFAPRDLSLQRVEAGGDYVWTVKQNQPDLKQDSAFLFQPEQTVKGFSPATKDFRTAQTYDKGHGRTERRQLTVSGELKGYLDWPGAEQVFKLERWFTRTKDGQRLHEVVYGITSLTAQEADAHRLLTIVRSHWGIENGLHYRRDETLGEDRSHRKGGHAPRAMAVLNNLIIGLVVRRGYTKVAAARRYFDAHPNEAQQLVLQPLS